MLSFASGPCVPMLLQGVCLCMPVREYATRVMPMALGMCLVVCSGLAMGSSMAVLAGCSGMLSWGGQCSRTQLHGVVMIEHASVALWRFV